MKDDLIKKRTLYELEIDYDFDINKFIKSLEERMSIGKYFNDKYSFTFEPFPLKYYKKQKEILETLTYSDIAKYKDSEINEKAISKIAIKECKEEDNVINKAPHYNIGKYECIDVMKDVFGKERLKIWCILNAFKYLYRCYYKNGDQDLKKATYYLNYIEKNLLND